MSNIVFMGMGEPFLNWENVKKSLGELIDPKLFAIGSRSISVSTAGVLGLLSAGRVARAVSCPPAGPPDDNSKCGVRSSDCGVLRI